MISIIEHIEYLVMSNDCVVVPGWGAFIAQYSASSYAPISGMMWQPSRKIGFNASITHNDGLLANSIVRRHNISYDKACEIIESNISVYRQLIKEGSEIPFGRLGFFSVTAEGNVEFTPFYHETSNDAYYGLRPLSILTLEQIKAKEPDSAQAEAETQEPATVVDADAVATPASWRHWVSSHVVKIAASIAILIGIGLLLSTPIAFRDASQQLASLNMPKVESPKIEQPKGIQGLPAEVNLQKPEATPVKSNTINSFDDFKSYTTGQYYLVVGTLSSQKATYKFLAEHSDMANVAKVQYKRGKYRVYIARSDDYDDLVTKAQRLPDGSYGWVTKD